MAFLPKPGTRIKFDGSEIEFTPLEEHGPASSFLYAEDGKEATVYRVIKDGIPYALKVFYPEYQDIRLVTNSSELSRFKTIGGLRAAERTILTKQEHSKLIKEYPELEYAILMPWIEGNVWGNVYTEELNLSNDQLLQIANSLVSTVSTLETKGMAHCDLSNNNFVFDESGSSVELIDIEGMYAPNMPRPVPDVSYGTEGYRTSWIAEQGLWGPEADRFACAILCAEILTWHVPEVRQKRSGDSSYFEEEEVGTNSARYQLVHQQLGNLSSNLAILLEQTWRSQSLVECPKVSEWKDVIEKIAYLGSKTSIPTQVKKKKDNRDTVYGTTTEGGSAYIGVPPKMVLNRTGLTFSIGNHPITSITLLVQNKGGARLEGFITPEHYLSVSPEKISIDPGVTVEFVVSLKNSFPKPHGKTEYRSACGLQIETNSGNEVLWVTIKPTN